MRQTLLVLMCLILVFSIFGCSKNDKYKVIVAELNEQLPVDYPGGIRIEKVALDGGVFKYYYTFREDPEVPAEEFVSTSKGNIVSMVRNHSELKVFRADKMTITFVFRKKDGSPFTEIVVTPEDYK